MHRFATSVFATRPTTTRRYENGRRGFYEVDVPLYAYFRHEDAPTAPAYAERLLELLDQ